MNLLRVFGLIGLFFISLVQADNEFPGRATYPKVQVMDTEQLNSQFDEVIIVDVRSAFEFDTLHINKALNIPLNSKKFVSDMEPLLGENKPIVFYCNGHSCYKSYKAANKIRKANSSNVYAYDAGIFDWAKAHPEKATLVGKTPVDRKRLISKEDFQKRLLSPANFTAKIEDKTLILDIREPAQRGLFELFPYRQENIHMDEKTKLNQFLSTVKKQDKALLVYDEAGKQVTWLQYYLEDKEISNYYFMDGGAKGFFKVLQK
ncbi:MAG: rhodanese-like domain-containing protein [Gammaproteobacteria bacterium]|nr:rhodanese-like domain-containing protein [Gammaproteobacteria bacterium]